MKASAYIPKSEQTALALANLYGSYGFRRYKVGCFENYAEYLENKNFMPTEQVITFGGKDGKLLALKPDITMSIVKNVKIGSDGVEKLFYKEDVFRPLTGGGEFKEISQMGVEIIGMIDDVAAAEFSLLALESLSLLSDKYILDLSHIGFFGGLLEYYGVGEYVKKQLLTLVAERNAHGLNALYKNDLISKEILQDFTALIDLSGAENALEKAKCLVKNETMQNALDELCFLKENAVTFGYAQNVRIDFTISSDLNYYSGLVCKGYVAGIPRPVLSGGRYDKMASRLQAKECKAVGFAVYLGELSTESEAVKPSYLIYGKDATPKEVRLAAKELRDEGFAVKTAPEIPENGFDKLFILENGTVKQLNGGEKC